jgi:hypothetical protein|tara:strand:+ start:21 stop:704 length:684 start_codon:yes stop_codon:yes gene_type:complete
MKKLLGILVLGLLWCNNSFADPIEYIDDWHLLDKTKTNILKTKDSNGSIKLSVQEKNLILTLNKKTSSIYQFNNDKFDIYLIKKENNLNVIYIFNHTTKTLLAADIDKSGIIFKEMPWEYGLLMAIFKNCNKIEESLYLEIKQNYFLTKYKYKERPKKYKCGYLIYGGRCYLIYDPKTDEYEIGDKMIVSNDLKYVGDLDNISDLLKGFKMYSEDEYKCELYNKISL